MKVIFCKLLSFLLISLPVFHTHSYESCKYYKKIQLLDHFSRTKSYFYQRYLLCDFREESSTGENVIFFYCGNESPVDLYINNTGLMFQMNDVEPMDTVFNKVLIFAEHRFFGDSKPTNYKENLGFLSSKQAIEDYKDLIYEIRILFNLPKLNWPVISFGGSYGGMLSAWFRFKHPEVIQGSIASSAPIFGFPFSSKPIDGVSQLIGRNIRSYSARSFDNFLASWVIIVELSKIDGGKELLRNIFKVCNDFEFTGKDLVTRLQNVFSFYSEGNYNFPTNYITYSTLNTLYKLPKRPLKVATDMLDHEFGVEVERRGKMNDFVVQVGDTSLKVNWDNVTIVGSIQDILVESSVISMLKKVSDSYFLFYNVSEDVLCLHKEETTATTETALLWESIVCNDAINFVPFLGQGLGKDLFWPPTTPPHVSKKKLLIESVQNCPEANRDPFSEGLAAYYGGNDFLQKSSKIIFTNGGFDIWSVPSTVSRKDQLKAEANEIYFLNIKNGAHHSELFYRNNFTTMEVLRTQSIIKRKIFKWIKQ